MHIGNALLKARSWISCQNPGHLEVFQIWKKTHLGFIFDNALLGMKNMPGDSNQKDVPCTPFELSSG